MLLLWHTHLEGNDDVLARERYSCRHKQPDLSVFLTLASFFSTRPHHLNVLYANVLYRHLHKLTALAQ